VDIFLESENVGIEVLNWRSPHFYESRCQSILENLKPYPVKFLITSYISKEMKTKIENYYTENPVKIIILNRQLLPKKYEKFYTKAKGTKGKKFVSKRTRKLCRNILTPLFNTLKKEHNIGYVYRRSISLLESPPSFYNSPLDMNWNGETGQLITKSPDQTEEIPPGCNVTLHSLVHRCSSLESFAHL
jgi:hypothetical protein